MKRRTLLTAALGGTVLGSGAWWIARERLQEFATAGIVFGTTVSLRVLHEDEHTAKQALDAALAAVRDVDRLMSLHRADSELSRLNRDSRLLNPDPRVVTVLKAAQDTARLTHGAFDVTVQPLWMAAVAHSDSKRALSHVDWRRLEVSDERITLHEPGMAVTLNGIAQGYGADVALATLTSHGISHALLDTGEFSTLGQRDDGLPWMLAVRDPRDAQKLAHTWESDGRALATSGDYETTFSEDFSQHHIFDPKTGQSPQQLASVSVLAPSGMQADALSTACMVMGMQASLQLAERVSGVDVLCISKRGEIQRSAGFPVSLV